MRIRTAIPTLLSVALALVGSAAIAQPKGAISGTVVDQTGAPISRAMVRIDPADGRPRVDLVRYVDTNREGEFLMDRLDWGKYRVFAMKESAGFPNMVWSFYSNNVFPRVSISPKVPLAQIRLRLGAKAAILTGVVADATTGKPLNPGFKLIRAESPEEWLSVTQLAHYRVLIPSSTKVIFEVSAPGYETLFYGGPKDPARHGPVYLEPDTVKRLDIKLRPKTQGEGSSR